MANPVRPNQPPQDQPVSDQYQPDSSNYDTGGAWEDYDMGDTEALPGYGDESFYMEGEGPQMARSSGGLNSGAAMEMAQDLLAWLRNSSLTGNQREEVANRIKMVIDGIRASGNGPLSPDLANELYALQAQTIQTPAAGSTADPFADDFSFEEGAGASEENGWMIDELEGFKRTLADIDHLDSSKRNAYETQIDGWIDDLREGRKTPEDLQSDFEALQEEINNPNLHSQGAQSLASLSGKSVEEIAQLAEAKGINLADLPEPPTATLFEFLADLVPSLGEAHQAAKQAVLDKTRMDEDMVAKARATSRANARSTTDVDSDRRNFDEFYYLLDAQEFKDSASQDMAAAFQRAAGELVGALQSLYPDTNISALSDRWSEMGQITFGNDTIDILANRSGNFISSSPGMDMDLQPPEMITLEYDWEGDGDYEDVDGGGSSLRDLQAAGYPTHKYD